jgi:apolipoprotein D and lipocalin family protein
MLAGRRASVVTPWLALAAALGLGGCVSTPSRPTVSVAPAVDLQRFMGDWYVIANIPTFIEKGAHNAIETYALDADGTIATTFTFNKDAFDGPAKRYTPRGFVRPGTQNAVWGMRFIWPIKAEYVISYVDPDYTETIIGRSARDYVWIMARTPTLPAARYEALVARVKQDGYDLSQLQRVPQQAR